MKPEHFVRLKLDLPHWQKNFDHVLNQGNYIEIRMDSLKWYEYFEDVKEFEAFLQTIPPEEYHFHRLGEEYGDYAEHGGLSDDVFVYQELRS
jgi:hypothetical protein